MPFNAVGFGEFLRRLRKADGLSISEVIAGSHGNIRSGSQVSGIEAGQIRDPNVKLFVGLALGLGVNTIYLLERAGFLSDEHTRMDDFSLEQRRVMSRALGAYLAAHPDEARRHAPFLVELQNSLAKRDLAQLATFENRTERGPGSTRGK